VTEREPGRYNQYRVIKLNTIEDLAGEEPNELKQERAQEGKGKKTADYYDQHFTPCNRIRDGEVSNMGINRIQANHSEIDFIMQALCLLPDDPNIPLIEYSDSTMFSCLANQSLPGNWRL
jgi:hypothetical protein